MNEETISILDGSTFLVSSTNGDVNAAPDQPNGLFFKDTRHLSRWELTVNGAKLDALSTDTLEYYHAQFFCVRPTGTIYKNPTLSVLKSRFVGNGFVEDVTVINHASEPEEIDLLIQVDSDFADLFEVKDALKKKGEYYRHIRDGHLVLGYKRDQFSRETIISASVAPTEINDDSIRFRINVPAKQEWHLKLSVTPVTGEIAAPPKFDTGAGDVLRRNLAQWLEKAPTMTAYPDALRQAYNRNLVDLAALRFHPEILPGECIPAAGLPWFMALFGRDSIITSYQLLPFIPELSATTLRVLAAKQGKVMDDFREEEPGRILHELRFGELTHFKERPQSPYFGASDATPLFLVLMDEYERWSGDTELIQQLKPNALAALEWIDHYGDSDGDGYIEYQKKTNLGLDNQCWKDSWNSILFADGSVAPTPRATCEIQGYAYDAKVRCARLARAIWKDEPLAKRLEKEAAEFKRRFNKDFWIPERGFYALALDGSKRKVDSLTSNIGHLLWSGIVDNDKAPKIVEHLMGPKMFSGWGIRTMAMGEGGYSPIEYHNGTVWPHDNSIIAAGLARYGYRQEAAKVISAIFEASATFNYRLPEVFAGYRRERTGYPVKYPTASSPQAWASGAPLLCFRVLLGLEPEGEVLKSDPVLPSWIGTLNIENIPGRWGQANVMAEQKGAPTYKQLYARLVVERECLDEEEKVDDKKVA
jgi:glycogen debranching enzyme